jgi:prepilin-type N-terminal cleavage/methylation domain-containing protein
MLKGFTTIELIIVIAIIAILAGALIYALKPGERLAKARDDQREVHLNAILHAIEQKLYFEKKWDPCAQPPATWTEIGSGLGKYDLYSCLIPSFLPNPLFDPLTGYYNSSTDYATGYKILYNPTTTKISLYAPGAELRKIYLGESP